MVVSMKLSNNIAVECDRYPLSNMCGSLHICYKCGWCCDTRLGRSSSLYMVDPICTWSGPSHLYAWGTMRDGWVSICSTDRALDKWNLIWPVNTTTSKRQRGRGRLMLFCEQSPSERHTGIMDYGLCAALRMPFPPIHGATHTHNQIKCDQASQINEAFPTHVCIYSSLLNIVFTGVVRVHPLLDIRLFGKCACIFDKYTNGETREGARNACLLRWSHHPVRNHICE